MAEAMVAAWQAEITPVWTDLADLDVLRRRLLQAEVLWVWLSTRALLPSVVGVPDRGRAAHVVVADPGEDAPAVLSALWRRLGVDAERVGQVATAELAAAVVAALGRHGGDVVLPPYPAFAGGSGSR
jgi:acyl transferase domain-containing protein